VGNLQAGLEGLQVGSLDLVGILEHRGTCPSRDGTPPTRYAVHCPSWTGHCQSPRRCRRRTRSAPFRSRDRPPPPGPGPPPPGVRRDQTRIPRRLACESPRLERWWRARETGRPRAIRVLAPGKKARILSKGGGRRRWPAPRFGNGEDHRSRGRRRMGRRRPCLAGRSGYRCPPPPHSTQVDDEDLPIVCQPSTAHRL
jgi:hypothetical protein